MEKSSRSRGSRAARPDDLESLWARHVRGDADALGTLCAGVAPVLLRRATSITRDHALAEDAVQETFLDLVRGAHAYDARRPLLPWLIGIATRKALKARRSDRRRPDPARLPRVPAGIEVEPTDEASFRALKRFAEPYRSAALLRWRYDLSPAEVARLRGEPAGTTRSLLSRAIAQLRRIASTLEAVLAVGLGWRWLSGLRRLAAGPEREATTTIVATTGAAGGAKGLVAVALSGIVGIGSTVLVARVHASPAPASEVASPVTLTLPSDWGFIHRHRPSVSPVESPLTLPG